MAAASATLITQLFCVKKEEIRMVQNTSHTSVIYPAHVASLKKAWTYTTGDAIESSPAVIGGVVYIGSHDHHLYALEASTGTKRWSYKTNGAIYATQPLWMTLCMSVRLMQRSMPLKPARARCCGATPHVIPLSPPPSSSVVSCTSVRL